MLQMIQEQLPKALLGALIPLVQFLWQQYRQRGMSVRKSNLRKTILELSHQLEEFPKLGNTEVLDAARKDLEAELASAVAALSELTVHPTVSAPRKERSLLARGFLLYAPRGAWAWTLHVLFFVNITTIALGLIGVFSDWDDDAVSGLIGMAFFCLPALLWRALALRLDRKHRGDVVDTNRRVLPKKRWIPILLFWYALVMIPTASAAPFMDEPGGFSAQNLQRLWPWSLGAALFFIVLATCSRGWTNVIVEGVPGDAAKLGGIRGVLMLYRPSQKRGWCAIIGFWVAIAYFAAFVAFVVRTWKAQDTDLIWMTMLIVAMCGAVAIAARGWSSRYAPLAYAKRIAAQQSS